MKDNFVQGEKAVTEIRKTIADVKADIGLIDASDFMKKLVATGRAGAAYSKSINAASDEAINKVLNPADRPSMKALENQAKDLKSKIAALYVPSPAFGFGVTASEKAEYAKLVKSFIQPANIDDINAVLKQKADLQRQLNTVNFEIKDRQQDAGPAILASRTAAMLATAKSALEVVKVWRDGR